MIVWANIQECFCTYVVTVMVDIRDSLIEVDIIDWTTATELGINMSDEIFYKLILEILFMFIKSFLLNPDSSLLMLRRFWKRFFPFCSGRKVINTGGFLFLSFLLFISIWARPPLTGDNYNFLSSFLLLLSLSLKWDLIISLQSSHSFQLSSAFYFFFSLCHWGVFCRFDLQIRLPVMASHWGLLGNAVQRVMWKVKVHVCSTLSQFKLRVTELWVTKFFSCDLVYFM